MGGAGALCKPIGARTSPPPTHPAPRPVHTRTAGARRECIYTPVSLSRTARCLRTLVDVIIVHAARTYRAYVVGIFTVHAGVRGPHWLYWVFQVSSYIPTPRGVTLTVQFFHCMSRRVTRSVRVVVYLGLLAVVMAKLGGARHGPMDCRPGQRLHAGLNNPTNANFCVHIMSTFVNVK